MAEIELTDIFKNRWIKRIIWLAIFGLIIWKLFPNAFLWVSQNSLDRATRIVVRTIREARVYTLNHESDYAADFNLQDNTFSLVYPRRANPNERKIINEMMRLPGGIEIVRCTFKPILITDKKDPDYNQLIFRIRFSRNGDSLLENSGIWLENKHGQGKRIFITNPRGKIEIH